MYTKLNKTRFQSIAFFLIKPFYKLTKTSLNLYSNERKTSADFLLDLLNPVTIIYSEQKIPAPVFLDLRSNNLSDLTSEKPERLDLNLNAKPSFKLDKKSKKIEKDEDQDSAKSRIKVKKKVRTKIDFDEEFDPISEDAKGSASFSDAASLSLQRPLKPKSDAVLNKVSLGKTKLAAATSLKNKKNVSPSFIKKEVDLVVRAKPEVVSITKPMTIHELSELFFVTQTEIIKNLFFKGISVTINQCIDVNTAVTLGKEFDIQVNVVSDQEETRKVPFTKPIGSEIERRAPIITIMGHVDHGKTSLLDKIRKTQLAQKESGGITQKLGAYEVEVEYKNESKKLVFLDTPGHEAFSGMRSRGIQVTDIAILVVAADDGVRPQTVEAINYIQGANVPVIVAINKIDKEDANIENIKQELSKYNLISESWGGDTVMVPISAKQGTNVDTLLEMILLLADVENFTADSNTTAQGTILESHIDKAKGPVASVLVQNGTLKLGDVLVSGDTMAKVRGIINSNGEKLNIAPPSSPVLIWGLSKPPTAGDTFAIVDDEKEAKLLVQQVQDTSKKNNLIPNLSDTYTIAENDLKGKINLIIKTDIQGSVEAIVSTICKITHPKVYIRILHASAGEITETDIDFAYSTKSIILAFNTNVSPGARKSAKSTNVLIEEFNVVYDLFDYVQDLIEKLVGPEYEEQFLGSALVKTVFPLGKSFVAGTFVSEGKLLQSCHVKVFRNNEIVYQGNLTSLKRLKEDVDEVKEGLECGVFLKEFDGWASNDLIKAFDLIPKKRNK